MAKLPFRPVVGTDAQIQQSQPAEGYVWFATDTKKIYYSDGVSFLSMGGNSNVFYGVMELEDTPDEGQTEFTFSIFDIDGNSDITDGNYIIPNVDDLILNIPDGCFYRVIELEDSGEDTIIYTTKLTIAGSGGGGGTGPGGGDSNSGTMTFDRITPASATCLYKQPFLIEFNITATDASGESTGNGTYTVTINGKANAITGIAKQGYNSIDVGPYLDLRSADSPNSVRIYVTMDTGGSSLVTQSKRWDISTTQIELTWDYDETEINSTSTSFQLFWTVSGYGIEKTTHIIIDDNYYLPEITSTSTMEQNYIITDLAAYNLVHGAHKFEMYVTANVGGTEMRTPTITKNVIFQTLGNDTPIISCPFFASSVTQYNTVEIPLIFYKQGNNGELTATLKENGIIVDTLKNIFNGVVYTWYYTPIETTTRNLVIQCGTTEKTLILEVEALNIDNEEVGSYAFKFKASEFASNNAIQEWKSNDVTATFSDNFDWVNGGLKAELDEKGNTRQYVCVRAGTTMTINYPLFQQNATYKGKVFKFIFKATNCRDYDAQVLDCYDPNSKIGLQMFAQQTILSGTANSLTIPYCEDSYIEFEFDITATDPVKRYIIPWLDGVPAALKQYSENEQFMHNRSIVIGSPDCDVNVYLIKAYERHLVDEGHLQNFIADAPNAQEMLDRFNRNDILDKERGVISPILLAQKNPNCRVHVYDISRMTLNKKDKIKGCSYKQYHASNTPVLTAENVTIKVQGTSSAAYGMAAFNIDSKFENGFVTADGTAIEGWSMNKDSIPVNYFCTKVNVASAEHTNNAMNQEWYNRYQPYTTNLRKKNPKARDTMEFTPGVLFLVDHNTQKNFSNSDKFISNNVFAEIDGYTENPYERMYSICNMGNSKKNVEVLHDTSNPIEYCIEIADNQKPMQWMTWCDYTDDAWDAVTPDWEFRYPDGHKEIDNTKVEFISPLTGEKVTNRQHAFDSWRRFITWMAKSNPQPAYEELAIDSQEKLTQAIANSSAESAEIQAKIDTLTAEIATLEAQIEELEAKGDAITEEESELLSEYRKTLEKKQEELLDAQVELKSASAIYVAEKDGDTVLLKALPITSDGIYDSKFTYFAKTTNTYGYTNAPLENPVEYGTYTFSKSDYTNKLGGSSVTEYNGRYTHDTYRYRMAKMLNECEDYLVMDSVVFHYLFIERHTMIDNVSKNTFWSTEDGFHWNLTKDYDNDTSDGNDNQGKLTLSYGIEPLDNVPGSTTDFYFNANQAVWFRFCGGIYEACRTLYNALESTGESGQENAWDATSYLEACKNWQSSIPERCWIEDYYRKYIRPLEVYGDSMFVDMLEGGQKTHQRKQYETYQNYYISSKYVGKAATDNRIIIRGNGNEYKKGIPASVYADCYIQAAFGTGSEPNVTMRVKRNEPITIQVPASLGTMDNATIYFYLPQLYQTIGELDKASLNTLLPEQITMSPAVKLRTLVGGQYGELNAAGGLLENPALEDVGFLNNTMLEELYMCNYPGAALSLDLKSAINLKTLDLRNSGFTDISIADGAPLETAQLQNPTTISMSNLRKLSTLTFADPTAVKTVIIDNIDNNEANSKDDILDVCTSVNSYSLKNVQWEINNAAEINTTDKTINVLERVYRMSPYTKQGQAEISTSITNLTGKLKVDVELDNNTALDIYNYYAVEIDENLDTPHRRFPNLDIDFAKNNLITITIVDGNDSVIWQRKMIRNSDIDTAFLSNSPYGPFDINSIKQSPTEYYEYEFTGKWEIYNSETGAYVTTISGDSTGTPTYTMVGTSITLKPIFSQNLRKWTINFYNDTELLATATVDAGTLLSTAIREFNPSIPWKDDSKLDTYVTYSFEGYALSKTATSGLKAETYPITSNMELYAIFKQVSVYDNIHEDYWLYELVSSNAYGVIFDNVSEYQIESGYIIMPNPVKELKGKVTIPATYKGLPVYRIGNNAFENNTLITHVFVGKGSKLRVIGEWAFANSQVKFFEFTDQLRRIEDRAFMLASRLEPDSTNSYIFGSNLYYLGGYAFNQALNFNGKAVTIMLPPTLKIMGYFALSNFAYPTVNSSIMIGQPGQPSDLDLTIIPGGTSINDYRRISDSTTSLFPTVSFYSKIYYSADDPVTLASFGSTYTVGQMLGNDSGGVGFVEVNPAT